MLELLAVTLLQAARLNVINPVMRHACLFCLFLGETISNLIEKQASILQDEADIYALHQASDATIVLW